MSTLASLRILLGLDAGGVKVGGSEARAEMGLVRADAQRTAASVNTAAADMGRSFGGVGASIVGLAKSFAGIAAITGAGALFADSIKGAIDEEQGIARLTASLRANIPAWDGNTAAIERTIKAREEFGFSDDELRSSLTGLLGATHDINQALSIQSVALDLARFKHISLAEASDALTKVEAGSFRILKSLGIELRDGATQTEALAAVQKLAAGQAQEFADSTAGAGAAAAVAFHDAEEALGKALIPLLRGAASVVKNVLAPALELVASQMDKILPVIEAVAVGMGVKVVASLAAAAAAALGFGAAEAESAVASTVATNTIVANEARKAAAVAGASAVAGVGAAAGGVGLLGTIAAAAVPAAVAVAGVTVTVLALKDAYEQQAEAGNKLTAEGRGNVLSAASGATELARQTAFLSAEVAKGTITQAAADAALQKLRDSYGAAGLAAIAAASSTGMATDTLGILSDTAIATATATDELAAASLRYAQALTGSTTGTEADAVAKAYLALVANDLRLKHEQLTDAFGRLFVPAKEAPQIFGNVADAATNAGGEMVTAADQANALTAALGGIPTDIEIHVRLNSADVAAAEAEGARLRQLGETGGAGVSGSLTGGGGPIVPPFEQTIPIRDPGVIQWEQDQKQERERRARERQSEADRAAREAEQKARDSARQQASDYRDAMSAAYDKISADAHKVFDAVHAANLKIIRDAQDTANAQIEAQEKAIRGFVTGEQAKLDAERAHRRELELRADVADAVSPEDRARAQQSLNDFLADQRIAFLSAQADTQVAALDAAKAANDATAAAQTQAENDRFKQQTTDFDKELKALEDGLKRHPELWKSSQENVLKLLLAHNVDYQTAGTAAGKAYADGLLAASLAIEQAARGVAVAGARAEGNVVVAPPVVPVVPTPPAQQSTDASYAAVTVGYSKSPAPERSVQSQITPMGEYAGGGQNWAVYLDGERVGDLLARRGSTLDAIYNPVPVSIGPKR